ncbi:MAG: hypothetical protein ACRDF7_06820 [Candidatus Limnocylindrales bacterium]
MPLLLPILLVIHIGLAIGLFLPCLLLPFTLGEHAPMGRGGRVSRVLLRLQAGGSVAIGIGLALSGGALVLVVGPEILGQPWLIVALGVYAANLAAALVIQRPGLRRLLGSRAPVGPGERMAWNLRARRQRYVSYVMTAAVGVIGFLMSTKPELW